MYHSILLGLTSILGLGIDFYADLGYVVIKSSRFCLIEPSWSIKEKGVTAQGKDSQGQYLDPSNILWDVWPISPGIEKKFSEDGIYVESYTYISSLGSIKKSQSITDISTQRST
jgi:hypothetical protein